MARPTKLTPQLRDAIADAIRTGNYAETAATAHGITPATYYNWINRGKAERERTHLTPQQRTERGDPDPRTERPFVEFLDAIERARAEADAIDLSILRAAAEGGQVVERTMRRYQDPATGAVVEEVTEKIAPGDWRAAAWRLERTRWSQFGRRQALEVSGPDGGPIMSGQVDAAAVEEQLRARLRQHLDALRGGRVVEGSLVQPAAIEGARTGEAEG